MDNRFEYLESLRNKCSACYRQFNRMDHLVEHMRVSYHSNHEPICGVCNKHCRYFDYLREHLIGPLQKQERRNIFSIRGCRFFLTILNSPASRRAHEGTCQISCANVALISRMANLGKRSDDGGRNSRVLQTVVMACKIVGGGSSGCLDLCSRVCIIDEYENIIFQTYVKPPLPLTKYMYEATGIRPEMLRDAMGLNQAQKMIQGILCNGETMWNIPPGNKAGKARILVGHHRLDHDLKRLQIEYPQSMIR